MNTWVFIWMIKYGLIPIHSVIDSFTHSVIHWFIYSFVRLYSKIQSICYTIYYLKDMKREFYLVELLVYCKNLFIFNLCFSSFSFSFSFFFCIFLVLITILFVSLFLFLLCLQVLLFFCFKMTILADDDKNNPQNLWLKAIFSVLWKTCLVFKLLIRSRNGKVWD